MGLKTWIDGVARGLWAFTRRAADDTGGNIAMLFGLCMPVLILMTVGGVDIHRASTVRVNLQDALDAAALAAARSPYVTDNELQAVGLASLRANLKAYPNITLREELTSFTLNGDEVVVATAKVDVKTLVANLFLPPYGKFMDDYLPVGAHSEVDRSSKNIEVALVLDVTGSMGGQKIIDLKAAAKELIDMVVQPIQTPYYSKVALVPYSMGVNLGSQAASARGAAAGSVNITNAVLNLSGIQTPFTGATRERPVVITMSSHGMANGDVIWISGASGMTQLNNKAYVVRNRTTNTFELYTLAGYRVDGRNYNSYSGNGKIQKCQDNDCSITITASNHGLSNNEYVHITDVNGMTQINNETFLVGNATTNNFTIDLTSSSLSAYTSGGRAWCAQPGCTYYAFENMYGDLTTHRISTCVSERPGTAAYTDAAPSTASTRVGRNYPGSSNPCLSSGITALSSNKSTLKNAIDAYVVQGSTAGQIGMAWGWYMVSPNFNSVTGSGAANYNTADTLKAVVIMTDGEFNTPYCNGVIARDAGSGSGNNSEKIDCAATNGNAFTQGRALCDGMKAQGIVVYTVGLQIAAGGNAEDLLRYCATSASGFFTPGTGADLSEAFAAIGRDITQLRISR